MKVKRSLMQSFGWARYRTVWIAHKGAGWLFSAVREEPRCSVNYISRPYPTAYGAASAGMAWVGNRRKP